MSGKSTSIFALIVAAIVLLIVGAMSYHEYLMAKLEREYGVRPASEESLEAMGNGSGAASGAAAPLSQGTGAGTSPYGTPPGAGNYPPAGSGAGGNFAGSAAAGVPSAAGGAIAGAPGFAPGTTPGMAAGRVPDPEIAAIREELAALKEENMLYQQRLESLQGDNGAGAGGAPGRMPGGMPAAGGASAQSGLPAQIQNGLPANPSPVDPSAGGLIPAAASEESDEMDALRKMIRMAPAIARVVHFDTEWSYIEIDGGKDRNIAEGDKFAVRRGFEIVGYVRVAEVFEKGAVADLTSANKHSETARKPRAGDELIKFDLIENVSPAG